MASPFFVCFFVFRLFWRARFVRWVPFSPITPNHATANFGRRTSAVSGHRAHPQNIFMAAKRRRRRDVTKARRVSKSARVARQPFHNQASIRRRFRKRHVRNALLICGVRVFVSVAIQDKRQRLLTRDSYEIASDPQMICVAHVIMHASGPTWGCPRALPAALRGVAARDPGSRDLTRCMAPRDRAFQSVRPGSARWMTRVEGV